MSWQARAALMLLENAFFRAAKRKPIASRFFFHSSSYSRPVRLRLRGQGDGERAAVGVVVVAVCRFLAAAVVEQRIGQRRIVVDDAAILRIVPDHFRRDLALQRHRLALADDLELLVDVVGQQDRPPQRNLLEGGSGRRPDPACQGRNR